MSNKAEIIIRLDAQGQREVQAALGGVRKESNQLNSSVGGLDKSSGGLATTFAKRLGPAMVGLALLKFGKDVIDVSAKFQSLNASLITVTGSQEAANKSFAWLQDFAANTPFQLDQVVGSFIKMQALGLNPTEASLRSFGNTASGMGKDLNQMIEAVADATVGEFERLKEFGIKASSQGDQVKFTFAGVSTVVQKESTAIAAYLQNLGDTKFGGAMARQMETIGGSMSNLGDSWDYFMVSLGKTGPIDAAASSFNGLSGALRYFGQHFELFAAYRDGKVGFWDWLVADATGSSDEIKKILDAAGQLDGELIKLKATVDTMLDHKQGNLWWSAADEAGLQLARSALKEYRAELAQTADVASLMNAADHSAAMSTGTGAPQQRDAGQVQMDIAAGNATEDDIWLKRIGLDAESVERVKSARYEIDQWNRDQDALETAAWVQAEQTQMEVRQEFLDKQTQQEIAQAEKSAREREAIERRAYHMKMRYTNDVVGGTLGLMSVLSSGLDKNNEKQFKKDQKLQRGRAIISTAAGVTRAFSDYGWPWGLIPAGLTIAAGAAQLDQINSTSYSGGGSIGGISGGSAPSMGGQVPAPAAATPAADTQPATQINIHIPSGVRIIDKTALDEFARDLIEPLANAGIAGVRG